MIASIEFMPRHKAEALPPDACAAVISITSPGVRASIRDGFGALLRLEFDEMRPLDVAQAEELTAFVRRVQLARQISHMVVHCEAGRMRSVTVALFVSLTTGASLQDRQRAIGYDRAMMRTLVAAGDARADLEDKDELRIMSMLLA